MKNSFFEIKHKNLKNFKEQFFDIEIKVITIEELKFLKINEKDEKEPIEKLRKVFPEKKRKLKNTKSEDLSDNTLPKAMKNEFGQK